MQEFDKLITKHREIEEALTRSFKELSDVRHALDEAAIVAITDPKGKITFVNDKFCEISQYAREELLGQDHRLVNSGYHSKEFMKHLWKTIGSGEVWHGELRNRAKDGSIYWVDSTIVPFLDAAGQPQQYVAIRFDITERKHMEDELKILPQRIIAAQETTHKIVAQEIHDDFGQLLIALKIFLVSTTADIIDRCPQLEVLSEGLKVRINEIIEKARNLSHSLAPPDFRYAGFLKALKELIASLGMGQKLTIEFTHKNLGRVDLEGKDIILYRIVQEALTNIIKHSDATHVVISLRYRLGKVSLKIKDNGKGFDIKHTGRSPRSLGLSVMRERAKLAGGILYIKSAAGAGTEIRLNVPAREKHHAEKE